MKNIKILFLTLALCALAGCTKEPKLINIDEIMEEVLAEMDYWGGDEDLLTSDDDTLLTEEEPTDIDTLTGDTDVLLNDE